MKRKPKTRASEKTSSHKDRPEAVALALAAGLGHLLGVDEVPGAPVALDEAPGARHVHGVPRVAEPVVLEPDSGLVAGGLAVALDDDAV